MCVCVCVCIHAYLPPHTLPPLSVGHYALQAGGRGLLRLGLALRDAGTAVRNDWNYFSETNISARFKRTRQRSLLGLTLCDAGTAVRLGRYKILFYFEAFLHERVVLLLPLHLHCPHDCMTITRLMRNIRPPPPISLLYAIHHTYWQLRYRVKADVRHDRIYFSKPNISARFNEHGNDRSSG